jgi:hypothetical protein
LTPFQLALSKELAFINEQRLQAGVILKSYVE